MSQYNDSSEAPQAESTSDGALLLDIYRRLVPLHATLTEHEARRPELARIVATDLMAVIDRIEASPSFRAALDADRRARVGGRRKTG